MSRYTDTQTRVCPLPTSLNIVIPRVVLQPWFTRFIIHYLYIDDSQIYFLILAIQTVVRCSLKVSFSFYFSNVIQHFQVFISNSYFFVNSLFRYIPFLLVYSNIHFKKTLIGFSLNDLHNPSVHIRNWKVLVVKGSISYSFKSYLITHGF